MQVSTVNGPRNNRLLIKERLAPSKSPLVSFQNLTSNSIIDGLAGLKLSWVLSPKDVNGFFVGIEIRYFCSHGSYGHDWYQANCACDSDYEHDLVTNGTELVINLKRF